MKHIFRPVELQRFRDAINRHLGLRFEDTKLDELAEVLSTRMKAAGLHKPEMYLATLATSRAEQHAVAGHLTVPETFFFRMQEHFRVLREIVVPEFLQRRGHVRILSAGCASGEEAYSIAMTLQEYADKAAITIRGVDINPMVIAKARQGKYSEWALRETPPEMREKYFRRQGRNYQLDDSIRRMVTFEEDNLMDPAARFWQRELHDVIFARNVLMYFSPECVKEVITRAATALVPGGYLFMGSAENLRGVSQEFHLCHTHDAFYYQRRKEGEAATSKSNANRAGRTIAKVETRRAIENAPQVESDWLNTIQTASERVKNIAKSRQKQRTTAKVPTQGMTERPPDVAAAMELLRQERFTEALKALPKDGGTNSEAQLLRAVVLANSGKLAEAEAACEALLKTDELNAGAHYVTALCREHAQDWNGAGRHDQLAIYLDPTFAMPHLHMGLLARRAQDLDAARRELQQAALLLEREDASRILLFGGGFGRESLVDLCKRELKVCGGTA